MSQFRIGDRSSFLFRVTRRKELDGEHLVRKPVHRSELQALRQNPVRPSKRYESAPKCWPKQSDDLTVPNWRVGGQPNLGRTWVELGPGNDRQPGVCPFGIDGDLDPGTLDRHDAPPIGEARLNLGLTDSPRSPVAGLLVAEATASSPIRPPVPPLRSA